MKINYSNMSNEQLDRVSAERFEIDGKKVWELYKNDRQQLITIYDEKHKDKWWADALKRDPEYYKDAYFQYRIKYGGEKWRPTSIKSNQCERYLFPKLRAKNLLISFTFYTTSFHIVIHPSENDNFRIMQEDDDLNDINRTKTIAALKTLDKLEGVTV